MKRPVVVLGATGVIGRGIVQAAVEAAMPVIAVARDRQRLADLQTLHAGADLVVLARPIASDGDAAALAKKLRRLGRPLAGVVAAVCGDSARGRLLDQPVSALRRELDGYLLPHLAAARHLLPLLAEGDRGGGYVLVGGPGGESPWAGYGHRSVAAAALRMLAGVLHDEASAFGVRVQLLAVDAPAGTEHNRMHACARWPSALAIGRHALELVGRGNAIGPTQAIVRFSGHAAPASGAGTPSGAAQDPERFFDGDARGCLDDARALLNTLTSSKRNEVSR